MKYSKKPKKFITKSLVSIFILFIILIGIYQKEFIYRSLVTVNLGSLYVKFLNEKAELTNFLKNNDINTLSFSLSPNNYVRLQSERARMVNNYVLTGNQWSGKNSYYNLKLSDGVTETKAEIRLFGLNPDHFRDVNGHSFRIKFDGAFGYGNRKVNFLNPRSRDFVTDPLLNIIFSKLYSGIGIEYKPYRVVLNKVNYGILFQEDFFDKYLIEKNKKRESVIFEIFNDSINFNYLGDDNSLEPVAFELAQLYNTDIESFIQKIDRDKLKNAMKLGLLINDEHPFSDINMHWYYNPVNDLIEPTLREGFLKQIDSLNLEKIADNNPIIKKIFDKKLKNEIFYELNYELDQILNIINRDSTYLNFKRKMVGFSNQIEKREKIIFENIKFLKANNPIKKTNFKNNNIEFVKIDRDTTIRENLTIGPNQKLIISPGVTVKLDNSYIKIYGGFEAVGTKINPIKILGINNSGTIFINSKKNIIIDFVEFKNLTNKLSIFDQPSSITFYECNSINISNSIFKENLDGDDYLNFFRSKNIFIQNSLFEQIANDAIDSDFSEVSIFNSKFNIIGNDAVDGSDSDIIIKNTKFLNVYDKAVSAGEKSNFKVSKSQFDSNEIGVVSKDASILILEENSFINNKIDFSSYVKKQFFGPSKTIFSDSEIKTYLIENNSNITGKDSIIYSTNVESKLYGNIYGRASN